MGINDERIYQIALSRLPGIGAKTVRQLIAYCGSASGVFNLSRRTLQKIPGIGRRLSGILSDSATIQQAERDLRYYLKHDIEILFYLDEEYPRRLRHFDDMPVLLYAKGRPNWDADKTVAVIGTRNPDEQGKKICHDLIEGLSTINVQLISGLAYGIDACAHEVSLNSDMENIAVMGTGMDVIYPAIHRPLARRIENQGALISEFPIRSRADKENFPRRNRIIAGLADAIVVVQSKERGGSLITAEYANQYNKDVFAYPGGVHNDLHKGCNKLIKTHKAYLIESIADFLHIMRWDTEHSIRKPPQRLLFTDLDDDEEKMLIVIQEKKKVSADFLASELEMTYSEMTTALLQLELKGLIISCPGNQFKAV
jgi:DNA processing protein